MNNINTTKESGISSYDYYIDYMESLGWILSRTPLTEKNTMVVNTSPLKKGIHGKFLNIRCPAGQKITFPGLNQFKINLEHFTNYPNLYDRPYSLSIRCTNDDVELSFDTNIRMTKEKRNGDVIRLDVKKYDDLSINADCRLKRLTERYYFPQGVELNGEEHMRFYAEPNIDITNIELFTKVDFWTS